MLVVLWAVTTAVVSSLTAHSPSAVLAQDAGDNSERVTELVRKAGEARQAGRYEESVDLLLQAYELYPDARLLFNMAKVFQDAGQCGNALSYFAQTAQLTSARPEQYVQLHEAVEKEVLGFTCGDENVVALLEAAARETPSPLLQLALGRRHESAGACPEARAAFGRVLDATDATSSHRGEARSALDRLDCVENDKTVGSGTPDPKAGAGPSPMAWAAYGLMGLGVLSLAVGIIVDQATLSDIDKFEDEAEPAYRASCRTMADLIDNDECRSARDRALALEDDIESGQLTTLVTVSIGVVSLVTGGVLWYLDYNSDTTDSPPQVEIFPTWSGEALGGTLQLRF